MEIKELPSGWCEVRLDEVVHFNPGIDKSQFGPTDELPFVPMPAVEAESGKIDTSEVRPFSKVKNGFTAFATGDVLFAKITPCMENGKMAVVPSLPRGVGFGTTEFHVLRATEALDEKYLYYFVSSAALRHEAQHHMTGAVGQKRVPKRFLETKLFALPPLREQQRIVEKIETLFAEIKKGEEALREAQKLLARYRQSVLKAAVTGELSASWRAINGPPRETGRDLLARILKQRREIWRGRGKHKEPLKPVTEGAIELPDGWAWATVDQLAKTVEYGSSAKCSTDSDGVPVLRMGNIVDGELDFSSLKFLPTGHHEFPKLLLNEGDILFNRTNSAELVGKTAVYKGQRDRCSFASYLIRVTLVDSSPDLVAAFINSLFGRAWVKSVVSQQVGQANVNGTKLRALAVPLPPQDEQRAIVELLEENFARMAKTLEWSEAELNRTAALRQSILKDAFSGKLVAQDSSDEPAEKLLDRIRTAQRGTSERRAAMA